MTRRKRAVFSDDSSSANSEDDAYEEFEVGDKDAQDERELYEDPYRQRKRRRLGQRAKDDATYGVFGEDDDSLLYKRAATTRKARTPVFKRSSAGSRTFGAVDDDEIKGISSSSSNEVSEGETSSEGEDHTKLRQGEEASDVSATDKTRTIKKEGVDEYELGDEIGRSGIGSRSGLGHSRAGLGMSFAPARNQEQEILDDSDTQHKMDLSAGGQAGVGSRLRLSFAPSSAASLQSSNKTATPPSTVEHDTGSNGTSPFPAPSSTSGTPAPADLPTSFATRTQRAFVRSNNTPETITPPVQLSYEERAHFAKISGGFGARMMAKMGWEAGRGLGASGQGIITPVETKLRPKANMGIAFGGFKERTKQAVAEDRRRGKKVSDDEDERSRHKEKGHRWPGEEAERSDLWRKKHKPKKVVVEHKTYEEIVREVRLDVSATHQAGVGPIIDATGTTPKEVSSLAALSASWTPSTDAMRIPEIRHNLRLMVDMTRQDVLGLAKEGQSLEMKKGKCAKEEASLSKKVEEEASLIRRLEEVKIVVDELAGASQTVHQAVQSHNLSDYEPTLTSTSALDSLSAIADRFIHEYSLEYEVYRIDEIFVGAFSPIFRLEIAGWKPLEEPLRWTGLLTRWKGALRMSERENEVEDTALSTFYGNAAPQKVIPSHVESMTPWEAVLWHIWLPHIRSAINNDWDATDPTPAVALYEAWYNLIPPFIQDNVLDQLILPKVQRAVSSWKPGDASLQSIVFPWLPHVGLRMEEFLGDTRRKVRSAFRAVDISCGVPDDLLAWKQIFDQTQWDDLVLKYIVPKLGATLRDDFRVNPRKQDMEPLNWVMEWFTKKVIRGSIMSQLFEKEFFPKWLDVLHIWLTQPQPGYDEIANWYSQWQDALPASVVELEGVRRGFNRGLEFIQEALDLDDTRRINLPKPMYPAHSTASAIATQPLKPQVQESLRDMVEAYAATHDVLFLPAGMVHIASRLPMYRVTGRKDGKGGVMVYFQDDVVWAVEGGTQTGPAKAVSFEEMILLASRGKQ